jgi:hypothetical protein
MNELLLFLRQSHGRRIVLFGTGPSAADHLSRLPFPTPVYAVDNDPARWGGQRFEGLDVRSPEVLRNEALDSLHVVIACTAIEEVSAQLTTYGLRAGAEFSPSPFL